MTTKIVEAESAIDHNALRAEVRAENTIVSLS
jgi:hypothetical protein